MANLSPPESVPCLVVKDAGAAEPWTEGCPLREPLPAVLNKEQKWRACTTSLIRKAFAD